MGTLPGFTSCFANHNVRQSTHYAIIDLNGDAGFIHSISMAAHAARSRGEEKMCIFFLIHDSHSPTDTVNEC